ncbi:Protein fmp52, mitochondrial [Xylographa bjoerkii]|nr:Protein fmp52, mitochondrial [Xylographa bjoerkii]MCJ1395969.1 Protein fmp52, mitochondrial [Xylographa bjoerkii]
MSEQAVSTALVGCTGLVGSHILSTLLSLPSHPSIQALGRRSLPSTAPLLTPHISSDTSTWPTTLSKLSPTPSIFLSALGTTRGIAGSFEAQRAIDYDLNLSLAKAAKESGVKVYVLISSAMVSSSSSVPYSKMKGELEDEVKKLDFPYTVILKPGLLVGSREDSRPGEAIARAIASGLSKLSNGWLTDSFAQDADVVAKAAVNAGMQCLEGKRAEKLWIVGQSDIVKLGKNEWKAAP